MPPLTPHSPRRRPGHDIWRSAAFLQLWLGRPGALSVPAQSTASTLAYCPCAADPDWMGLPTLRHGSFALHAIMLRMCAGQRDWDIRPRDDWCRNPFCCPPHPRAWEGWEQWVIWTI